MGALVLLAVASVPLSGKDLRRLARVELRATWLLPLALLLQVLVLQVLPDLPRPVAGAGHLVTYLLAAAFLVRNAALPGLWLVALGATLNGVTIALNDGTLPASRAALRFAGLTPEPGDFTNSGVLAHPRLAALGDVFAVPAGLPLANVFSVGDVLVVVGAVVLLHRACTAPPVPPLDPLLLAERQDLLDELDRLRAAVRETGARNEELVRERAAARTTGLPPLHPEQRWPLPARSRSVSRV